MCIRRDFFCFLDSFFVLLGGAFSFVASDVRKKIEVLEEFRNGPQAEDFRTVSSMMDYEMKNKLLSVKKYVSGSRTLLRLHRGLGMYARKGLEYGYKFFLQEFYQNCEKKI